MHADEVHQINSAFLVGAEEVPDWDPEKNYNTGASGRGVLATDQFITCPKAGLYKAALTVVNCEKNPKGYLGQK